MIARVSRFIVSAAAVVLIFATAPGNAAAATGNGKAKTGPISPSTVVVCTVATFSVSFSNGILTLVPRTTTTTTRLVMTSCASPGSPSNTSGELVFTQTLANFTCIQLLLPIVLPTFQIVWRTGATSTVTNGVQQVVGPAVVMSGTITGGLYTGQIFVAVLTGFPVLAPLECAGTPLFFDNIGVKHITGAASPSISFP